MAVFLPPAGKIFNLCAHKLKILPGSGGSSVVCDAFRVPSSVKPQVRNYVLQSHCLERVAQVEILATIRDFSVRRARAASARGTPASHTTAEAPIHSPSTGERSSALLTANLELAARTWRQSPQRAGARPFRTLRMRRGFRSYAGRSAGSPARQTHRGATLARRAGGRSRPDPPEALFCGLRVRARRCAEAALPVAFARRAPDADGRPDATMDAPSQLRSGAERGRASARSGFVAIFFDSLTFYGAPRRLGGDTVL